MENVDTNIHIAAIRTATVLVAKDSLRFPKISELTSKSSKKKLNMPIQTMILFYLINFPKMSQLKAVARTNVSSRCKKVVHT